MSERDKRIGPFLVVLVVGIIWWTSAHTTTTSTSSASDSLAALPWVLAFIAYFFPSFVASLRRVENTGPTFVINLFLGWTFIGWVVALAMAVGAKTRATP